VVFFVFFIFFLKTPLSLPSHFLTFFFFFFKKKKRIKKPTITCRSSDVQEGRESSRHGTSTEAHTVARGPFPPLFAHRPQPEETGRPGVSGRTGELRSKTHQGPSSKEKGGTHNNFSCLPGYYGIVYSVLRTTNLYCANIFAGM
jgi:hypothetical protein